MVGAGKMAGALVSGWVKSGVLPATQVTRLALSCRVLSAVLIFQLLLLLLSQHPQETLRDWRPAALQHSEVPRQEVPPRPLASHTLQHGQEEDAGAVQVSGRSSIGKYESKLLCLKFDQNLDKIQLDYTA